MNAIMNEKGRQTKLLAAIAVIAMVVCALAVAIPGVNAADDNNANLDAADKYTYSGDSSYTYDGIRTISGDAVWMTYDDTNKIDITNADKSMTNIKNDFARFIGALYYNSTAKVDSIILDGTTYTWNADKGNAGSNWYNGETSLVSATGVYIVSNATSVSQIGCIPMTLVVGETQTAVTYGIAGAAIVDGTDIYMSLSAAVAGASDGAEVVLISNNVNTDFKTITIDKNLTISGIVGTSGEPLKTITGNENSNDGAFIVGSNADVTIENLVIAGFGKNMTNNSVISAGTNDAPYHGTLNIDNCVIKEFGKNGITIKGGTGIFNDTNIDVTDYRADKAADRSPNGIQVDIGAEVTVTNCTIASAQSSTEQWVAAGILALRGGSVTITDSTVSNCETGLNVDSTYDDDTNKGSVAKATNSTFDNCETALTSDSENQITSTNTKFIGNNAVNGPVKLEGETTVQEGGNLDLGEEVINNSTLKIDNGFGLENTIRNDMTISDVDNYLTADTTILPGVTLTIDRNAALNLMGHDLIVQGTLVIERNGIITTMDGQGGSILLASTGAIQNNNGIIGDTMPIVVGNGEKLDNGEPTEFVEVQGVSGINFQLIRNGTGADREYNMCISGDVSRVSGTDVHTLKIKDVGINADLSISRDVIVTIDGDVEVSKNVTFTHNGLFMNIEGNFTLDNGAKAVINSPVDGKITVQTGKVGNEDAITGTPSSVEFHGAFVENGDKDYYAGVTGITISVDRINKYNETTEETEVFQRMYVTGTMDLQTQIKDDTTHNSVEFTGNIFVIDTLTIPDDVSVSGGTFMVSEGGSVVAINDDRLSYNGARYSIETTGTDAYTSYYYVDFATAMNNIASADDMTILLSGEYEISGTYTLAADQVIENKDAVSKITVGETGDITVELDGDIQDTAFYKILGKVLVKEGIGYTPSENDNIFAVKAVDAETKDTTYSGFGIAIDNAVSGQTITVVGNAEYDGNLVIPNGVTVDVQQDVELDVLGNVTVENGGKLILDNGSVMTVGKVADRDYTVTVNGELDASEGGKVDAIANVDFYSTGTSTFPVNGDNFGEKVTPNAAYYIDADQVYTSLANAVAYAETNALPSVYAVGTFSETGAIESDDVDILIADKANVTLGDVTLNAAKISITGTGVYTANVSGLSGAGDAAVTSTVSVNKTNATVESKVTLNAQGVNQYVLTISGLKGATTISAGTVQFADNAELSISRDNSLTIAAGATLLVAEDEMLTVSIVHADPSNTGYFVNNGTIQVDGTLTFPAATDTTDDPVLPGTVNVSETGAIDANGNITVTGDVTVATDGAFTVAGILSVGETPDYLGEAATGSVAGTVTLDGTTDNYVVVYAGASVADTVIRNSSSTEPETTAFQVNGLDLMTVYTFGSETLNDFQGTICGLDDLEGYKYDANGNVTGYVDLVWTAEGNTIPGTTAIGDYAIVSTELAYRSASIVVSVGTHITLTIDGIIVDNSTGYPVKIGTHNVSATIDPGYSGEITITFNGQTIQNGGTIEITSEMLSSLDSIVLSVTGTLTQDSTVVIDGGNQGGSDMGLTDYLLIVLVILIVIMAIIVALRLMRS